MQAELVLFNGRIHTMDNNLPLASAVALAGRRVAAVGDDRDVLTLTDAHTERIDLNGRTVLPGFTDAHLHLVEYALSLSQVQLEGVSSCEEAVRRVAERARHLPKGEWVRGWGWNRNLWPGARFPSKDDLDPVTPDHPVYLTSKDGHAAWSNSLALKRAGLGADTPDPPGGELVREGATGELTGVLKERAIDLMAQAAGPMTLEERTDAIVAACDRLHRLGIVGVHAPEETDGLAALHRLWRMRKLPLRVNVMIQQDHLDSAVDLGLGSGFGDEFLRLLAVKAFADGSLGTRSADMFEPYDGEPGNRGIEVTSSEELNRLVAGCAKSGWNVAIHAIGDRANCRVLDALEEQWKVWSQAGMRPRIEHAQLLSPQDAARLGATGVVASMQPIHCTSDMLMADEYWGSRCSGAYAWRSVLDSGAILAFGSDAPVEDPDVLRGVFAAVTRQREDGTPPGGWHSEQRLTVPEALRAYTWGAACAGEQEDVGGSLSVGKWGDLVVLSQDPFSMAPERILDVRVVATILGGEVVYRAE